MFRPGIAPWPLSEAVTAPPGVAFTVRVPLFEPIEVGLKTTEIMQVALGFSAPQVLVWLKSPPVTDTMGIPLVPPPVLLRVKTKGALALLTSTEAKSLEVGDSFRAAGRASPTP